MHKNDNDPAGIAETEARQARKQSNEAWLESDAFEHNEQDQAEQEHSATDADERRDARTTTSSTNEGRELPFGFATPLETIEERPFAPPWVQRVRTNPFYVLGIGYDAPRVEAERAGQKWLALLKVENVDAKTYQTPFERCERTEFLVRDALAEIADPNKRLYHEFWAQNLANVQASWTPKERFVRHDFPVLHATLPQD